MRELTHKDLNKRHAVVVNRGQALILNEEVNPLTGLPDVTFSRPADFKLRYRAQKEEVESGNSGKKWVSIAEIWLDWEGRRQYDAVVFEPGEAPEGAYNLWKGFSVEPQQGGWSLFHDHITENICGDNQEHAEWLFDWLAQLYQSPGGPRAETAIVLRGARGTGKGVFARYVGRPFGPHFKHVSRQEHVTGRFNGHLKDCILLFADESVFAGDKKDASVLKALITEPTHVIEEKFQNPLEVKNLVNVIMATNEAWAVPAGDHERRFFVLDVSDRRMQDRGYFRQLTEQMEDGGVEAMLHDLLNREIKHDIGEAPRTAALADQVRLTLGSVEAFWLDCLNGGEFFGSGNGEGWPSSIPKGGDGGLYDSSYLEYCRARRLRKTVTRLSFGKRLKKICPDIGSKRASKAPRREEYKLPPLEECRKAFSRAMGMPYSWADSEQEDVTNVSDAVSDEET